LDRSPLLGADREKAGHEPLSVILAARAMQQLALQSSQGLCRT
jgi:hypothetical protein